MTLFQDFVNESLQSRPSYVRYSTFEFLKDASCGMVEQVMLLVKLVPDPSAGTFAFTHTQILKASMS